MRMPVHELRRHAGWETMALGCISGDLNGFQAKELTVPGAKGTPGRSVMLVGELV